MTGDLPAHVLRLAHAPAAAALTTAFSTSNDVKKQEVEPLVIRHGSRIRVLLGLDPCRLCAGSRRSPETGLPCEVCTVVVGAWYPVP